MVLAKVKLRHAALAAVLSACAAQPSRQTLPRSCVENVDRLVVELNQLRGKYRGAIQAHLRDVSEIMRHLSSAPRDAASVGLAIDARGRIQVIRDLLPTGELPSPGLMEQMQRLNRMYETLHHYIEGAPEELRPRPPLPMPQTNPNVTTTEVKRRREFARRRV